MNKIPESDWMLLRKLKEEKLALACEKAFERFIDIIENRGSESHKAYLKLYEAVDDEDFKIARMFNDSRRRNARSKLANWYRYGVLNEGELLQFSERTQFSIRNMSED